MDKSTLGVYVHVPFCVQKCSYCDFLSFDNSPQVEDDYFKVLYRELTFSLKRLAGSYEIDSVFIGGGTPTVANPKYIEGLFDLFARFGNMSEDAEVTIEANPETLSRQKLKAYENCGINRISLGVQSFDHKELDTLGRFYTKDQPQKALDLIASGNIDNINIDLIFGFPGNDLSKLLQGVKQAANSGGKHISLYSLELASGTEISSKVEKNILVMPSDEENRRMYEVAREELDALGFHQYEISNFAKKQFACKHNIKYWRYKPYLGVGLGASSFLGRNDAIRLGVVRDEERRAHALNQQDLLKADTLERKGYPGVRFKNTDDMNSYICEDFIKKQEVVQNDVEAGFSDFMITGLRMNDGVDVSIAKNVFGIDLASDIRTCDFIKQGLLSLDGDSGRLALTDLGMDLANRVLIEYV